MGRPGLSESEVVAVYREFDATGSLVKTSKNTGIAKHRVVRAIYRRAGKCNCGGVPVAGGVTCAACLAKAKTNHVALYQARKTAGICVYCAEPLSEQSTVTSEILVILELMYYSWL